MDVRLRPWLTAPAATTLLSDRGRRGWPDGVRGRGISPELIVTTVTRSLSVSERQSEKFDGVEPRAYLRAATLRPVRNPGTVTLARDLKSLES